MYGAQEARLSLLLMSITLTTSCSTPTPVPKQTKSNGWKPNSGWKKGALSLIATKVINHWSSLWKDAADFPLPGISVSRGDVSSTDIWEPRSSGLCAGIPG